MYDKALYVTGCFVFICVALQSPTKIGKQGSIKHTVTRSLYANDCFLVGNGFWQHFIHHIRIF